MTLYEEALIQYDELEASFFQNLKGEAFSRSSPAIGWHAHLDHFCLIEHRISWINNVGGLAIGDDALPLLSTSNKPYRKLIDAGTISVFDFRIYLFARQAEMLFHLGRTVEAAKRGAYFVSTFARTLREHQVSLFRIPLSLKSSADSLRSLFRLFVEQALLGQNFVESWTYSACLNIVETCETHLVTDKPVTSFVAVKAELLELAKKQVRPFHSNFFPSILRLVS